MKNRVLILVFGIVVLFQSKISAQEINPELLKKNWGAFWINVPETEPKAYGVYNFRKGFDLKEKPQKFIVHVSGDNRYKLFVNEKLVSVGPARGDLYHWNFETIDIAPYLNSGKNSLAAIVWNDGFDKASAQITSRTGFILQGDKSEESIVNTNKSWKSIQDKSYAPTKKGAIGFFVGPPGEFTDRNIAIDQGWMKVGFDDSSWKDSETIAAGMPKGVNTMGAADWMLVPSSIPAMEMTMQRIQKVRKSEGVKIPSGFPLQKSTVSIPAHTNATILLDQSFLTNAYPTLEYSKGKNASVSITYSEGLYDDKMEKGDRNNIEGKKCIGTKDSLIANGRDNQHYTTLYWKTYRYIELTIQTKEEPLIINDFYGTFTGYPFKNNTSLTSEDPLYKKMLDIGWRTARLCAVDTYMDCPYYEQLQYVGDARIQAMISYYNSGDDRLARQAITAINNSRLSEGVTQSRFPATGDNIISTFSLIWIGMLNDYYHYRPDTDFVKSNLSGSRQILSFFDKYLGNDGTLRNSPYWNFVDWPQNPRGWKMGVPPLSKDGGSATLDFQLLLAYQWASELESNLGTKALGQEYHQKAEKLQKSIVQKYWDNTKKMFADTDEKKSFSQHANTFAILTGTISGTDAKDLFIRMDKDPDITRASIYFQYYVNQALRKVGLGDDYLQRMSIWKKNIELGMTTWGEDSNVSGTRSDCHAWGASPNIEFFRTVLGIDAGDAGFSKVTIEPHLGDLKKISGSIAHPNGEIKVDYNVDKKGKLNAVISLPKNIEGTFKWNGQVKELHSGLNTYQF